jgi:hypothetical protein
MDHGGTANGDTVELTAIWAGHNEMVKELIGRELGL